MRQSRKRRGRWPALFASVFVMVILAGCATDAMVVTHFHNDHIADLGEAMQRSYMLGREKDLVIYGPTGIAAIVDGFNAVYAEDSSYRTEQHTEELMPSRYHFATASSLRRFASPTRRSSRSSAIRSNTRVTRSLSRATRSSPTNSATSRETPTSS